MKNSQVSKVTELPSNQRRERWRKEDRSHRAVVRKTLKAKSVFLLISSSPLGVGDLSMLKSRTRTIVEDPVSAKNRVPVYLRLLNPAVVFPINESLESLSPRTSCFHLPRYRKCPRRSAHFANVDYRLNAAMAAFEKSLPKERLPGLCRILRKPPSIKAEFGVVVKDQWQGTGAAAELLKAYLHPVL